MEDKTLKDKAISIKGKDYVQVKDRIIYFNEKYPNGSIVTNLISDEDKVVMKAKVTPDVSSPERYFTGYSASNPSKSIEAQVPHEVAETSAIGRALAMMGIGVIDSVASVDEMRKVGVQEPISTLTGHCKIHNTTMTAKKGKYGEFWSHKLENGQWCNGK